MRSSSTTLSLLAGLVFTTALPQHGYTQAPQPPVAISSPTAPTVPEGPKALTTTHIGPGYCGPMNTRIYRFANATSLQEQSEILTTVRNITNPVVRVTISPTQGILVAEGTDEQLDGIQKIVDALDKPLKRSYRLTYTLVDLDGTKRLGDQRYSMVAVPGQKALFKQGNKIPIVTGEYQKDTASKVSQVTYLDIGMDIDATLDEARDVLRLKTKVARSSVVEDHVGATAVDDPIVRQSVFEGSVALTPGKTMTIGTLDITGTTRRIEIQVMAEPIAF